MNGVNVDLLAQLHEANFQLLAQFFFKASKEKPDKAKPYIRAVKDNYIYNTTLKMELDATKKELSKVRKENLEEITNLREQIEQLKKINKF